MSDLISRRQIHDYIQSQINPYGKPFEGTAYEFGLKIMDYIKNMSTVKPVRGEWVCWKEQCEYCMNRNTCPYPENQESMEALKKWEKENKFWGSLKLSCDYHVLDKDKYYLDNSPECNAEG